MRTYVILNYSKASRTQLAHYLQRTGWLSFGHIGTFTDDMLACIHSEACALVFLRLPSPDTDIPDPLLSALRVHPAVIATSPYPQHLFNYLNLHPFDFLTEPYSFERFEQTMTRYIARFG